MSVALYQARGPFNPMALSASPDASRTLARTQPLSSSAAAVAPASPPSSMHARPFYLSSSGTRNRFHKGCFSPLTYEPAGEATDARTGTKRQASVDRHGAPAQLHRGVTSLRARNTEHGVADSTAPARGVTMAGRTEQEWHPSPHGFGGSMRVQDNFRQRFEGVEGRQRHDDIVARVHGSKGGGVFRHGARDYPALFDPHVRGLDRNDSREPAPWERQAKEQLARGRVPHHAPFKGGSAALGVGAERAFLSHGAFPYHYSPYDASERSLSETKLASCGGGTGFRQRCEHAVHYPMKVTQAAPVRLPTETDRNPNFHSVQAEDETCRHRCNQVVHHARAHQHQQFSATAQF